MTDRLNGQFKFIVELDKMKSIYRRTLLVDRSRTETDAEHSWHIAVMALVFEEYAKNRGVELFHVVKMLLVHDLVEIYAGDTFCYDAAANADKAARETAAADRLFALLPADQCAAFRALWDEFEAGDTKEARFAAALDCLQPFFNNYHTEGHTWKSGVTKAQVLKRELPVRQNLPEVWDAVSAMIDECVAKGFLKE